MFVILMHKIFNENFGLFYDPPLFQIF